MRRRMGPALLAIGLLAAAAAARAQLPQPEVTATSRPLRLLRSWEETVKGVGGREVARRVDVIFDYDKGVALEEYFDTAGRRTGGRYIKHILPAPSREEIDEAFDMVRSDAGMRKRMKSLGTELTGGFLVEEPRGKPCGPGTRCLLVIITSHDQASIIQRSVVDLVGRTIVYRNFEPVSGGAKGGVR